MCNGQQEEGKEGEKYRRMRRKNNKMNIGKKLK